MVDPLKQSAPSQATPPPASVEDPQEVERRYLARIREECRYLDSEGVDRRSAELTDVFVMLQAMETPGREMTADTAPTPVRAKEMGLEDELPVPFSDRERRQDSGKTLHESPPPPVPLSEALKAHSHLILLGEPGTGKSTTLQYIALCFASQGWAKDRLGLDEDRVPVQIALRVYDGSLRLDDFLLDLLYRSWVPEQQARDWLNSGRLVILLDGLDEVREDRRSQVMNQIAGFSAQPAYQECRVVVTSRIAGYQQTGGIHTGFDQYTICPLTETEATLRYVTGWLISLRRVTLAVAQEQAQAFLTALARQAGLRRLIGNPLLLRLAIAVYLENEEMPANRAQLYRRYVRDVAWHRARTREESCWSYEKIEDALEAVAWRLQLHGNQKRSDLAACIEPEMPRGTHGSDPLDYLQQELGLLAVYGAREGEPLLAFRHLSFQEYFVALRLAEAWERNASRAWNFLRPRLHHAAWREPVLLLAGILKDRGQASDLTHRIWRKARSPHERLLHRDLLLSGAILGDGVQVHGRVADSLAQSLLRLFSDVDVSFGRNFRASEWAFGSRMLYRTERPSKAGRRHPRLAERLLGGVILVGFVITTQLKRPIATIIHRIAIIWYRYRALGRFGPLQDELDDVIIEASRAGAKMVTRLALNLRTSDSPQKDGIAPVDSLEDEDDALVDWPDIEASQLYDWQGRLRERAAAILLQLGAFDELGKSLENLHSRTAAAVALSKADTNDPRLALLLNSAAQSKYPHCRQAVAWVLTKRRESQDFSLLLRLAEDPEAAVSLQAIKGLALARSAPWNGQALIVLLRVLVQMVQKDEPWQLTRVASESLLDLFGVGPYGISIVHRMAVEGTLYDAIRKQSHPLWSIVSTILGEGDEASLLEMLLALIADKSAGGDDRELAMGFAAILANAKPVWIEPVSLQLLRVRHEFPHTYLLDDARTALAKIAESNPGAVSAVLQAQTPSRELIAVCDRFLFLGVPGATDALLGMQTHQEAAIRDAVAQSLGKCPAPDPKVISALRTFLTDEDERVRESAAWSLLELGEDFPEAAPFLTEQLKQDNDTIARKAADLLWKRSVVTPRVVAELTDRCLVLWYENPEYAQTLIKRLHCADPQTVESVLLEILRERDLMPEDDRYLYSDVEDERYRRSDAAAIIGFLGIHSTASEAVLLHAMADTRGARRTATWALGKAAGERASGQVGDVLLDTLRSALTCPPPTPDEHAAPSVPETAPAPVCLSDGSTPGLDEGTAESAILALGYVGLDNPEAKQLLSETFSRSRPSEPHWRIRTAAAIALARRGEHSAKILKPILAFWQQRMDEKPEDVILRDAWEQADAVLKRLTREQPESMAATLAGMAQQGDFEAVDAFLTLLPGEHQRGWLQRISRRLTRSIAAAYDALSADLIYVRLQGVVARLTELEVAGLCDNPPLFAPETVRRSPFALLIVLSALVASISGVASNIIASYLQESYQLITNMTRFVIVAVAFAVTLVAGIVIALRLDRQKS